LDYEFTMYNWEILSCDIVTTEGVWIDGWVYWALWYITCNYILLISLSLTHTRARTCTRTHTVHSHVTAIAWKQLPLVGSLPPLGSELTSVSTTSF
jgi:hypothetical protein